MAYVYINPYKSTYLAAKQELEQRKTELSFATQRITQLEEIITKLEPLAKEDGIAPKGGLSELCRQVLMSSPGVGMSAAGVMQSLAFRGVDMSGYGNPLAVLHVTLIRLCKPESGFVKEKTPHGNPMYAFDPNRRGLPPASPPPVWNEVDTMVDAILRKTKK